MEGQTVIVTPVRESADVSFSSISLKARALVSRSSQLTSTTASCQLFKTNPLRLHRHGATLEALRFDIKARAAS